MPPKKTQTFSAITIIVFLLHSLSYATLSHASMVSTSQAFEIEQQHYQKQQLIEALEQKAVQDKLVDYGVDLNQVKERVSNMTPEEIAYLNSNLENMPAGQGIVGALVLVFVVFIVTDMLCATDIYTFVKCINK